MKLPSLSRFFAPVEQAAPPPPEPIESTKRIDRIGLYGISNGGHRAWTVRFEGETETTHLTSFDLRDRSRQSDLILAKPGDRLRMVHVGDGLVDVRNLDL